MSDRTPAVSICLPNLNTRPFLEERMKSIYAQSLEDWELIISDNQSDDGAWEYLQAVAANDARVTAAQAPRKGLYPNWNTCLERARGRYVYIATSDDTMAPDCLQKLAQALDERRDCDIAHCPLVTIDESNKPVSEPGWLESVVFADGLGPEIAQRRHIRRAPYDGLLHLTGHHVVLSITQIMIRRGLFERTGPFKPDWGSIGDFNWEMKAGLLANMLHVPDTWASWRRHASQATASVIADPDRSAKIDEMIRDAVDCSRRWLYQRVFSDLNGQLVCLSSEMRRYYAELRRRSDWWDRRMYQLSSLVAGPPSVRREIMSRFVGNKKWPDTAAENFRDWMIDRGLGEAIEYI